LSTEKNNARTEREHDRIEYVVMVSAQHSLYR
jgi:hypothetical protein